MWKVCVGMALLAVSFTVIRPEGVFFFVIAIAFSSFAVEGHIPKALAIQAGLLAVMYTEWWLLPTRPTSVGAGVWQSGVVLLYIVTANAVLVGLGTLFVVRQQIALRQVHKATERERIARDLHDILGHTLSVITVRAELAGRLVERDPVRAKAEIEAVEQVSREALAEVREAIAGYWGKGVADEIERARSALEAAGIAFEARGLRQGMSPAQERVLGMALREGVTNVLRHSGAKRCLVSVVSENGSVRLEVRDDGRGMGATTGSAGEGMGMRGIRERVGALGGDASWRSDAGTVLTVRIPAVGR
jgi:two-component system sensor histidine kinase DesK